MISETDNTAANISVDYMEDPASGVLRKYASQECSAVTSLLNSIASYLTGNTPVTTKAIDDLAERMVWLNQVAYVYRTIPSGTSAGRERVITAMLESVAQAHRDVGIIKSWCSDDGAEGILNQWNEDCRLDRVMAELPPELRNEESRRLHRRPA